MAEETAITVKVRGDSGSEYTVTFVIDDGRVRAFCDCPAGEHGKLCKHRIDLLAGRRERLAEDSQLTSLEKVVGITDGAPAISSTLRQIDSAERELRALKRRLTQLKKSLGVTMSKTGFELPNHEE